MSLEDIKLITDGAQIAAAGKTLGLSPDESIELKRQSQMRAARQRQEAIRAQGGITEGNTLYADDERIRELDANEREFQKDFPIQEADLLGMSEYGSNEADLQQVSGGRIEGIKAVDASGIGEEDRGSRSFRRARRDLLPQNVFASVELPSGKRQLVTGVNQPGQQVPEELKEATKLMEMGLATPEREQVPYKTNKSGQRRRNFGYVQKDSDGEVIKERMKRVRDARGFGQDQNPEDIISTDKFDTAKRNRERGIGDDGPTEIARPQMAGKSALADAYTRLLSSVQSGEVGLDDVVEYSGQSPEDQSKRTRFDRQSRTNVPLEPEIVDGRPRAQVNNQRTVREVLLRMEDSLGGKGQSDLIRAQSSQTSIADMKARRERARRQLRQIAIQAKAEGNPLSREEATRLLTDLSNPKERSDLKAARLADDALLSGSVGQPTAEVIGETVMSEDSWKSSSQKMIPSLPIRNKAESISSDPVFAMRDPDGQIVGHSDGRKFLGETNQPSQLQNLNVPDNQRSLVQFISENLQYDNKGALKPAVITEATQAFTDIARGLKPEAFGAGVENIPSGIQSMTEAQRFVDRLIERREQQGKGFSRFNPENPGSPLKVPAGETPTVSDLMSTMRVDKATQGRLANALYQMALAEGTDINAAGKARYGAREGSYMPVTRLADNRGSVNLELQAAGTPAIDLPRQNITFDSPAGFFYDGVDAAYIPNSQRARIDGQNVYLQAALRGLKGEAASPFIGAVAGEPAAKLRYRKGFGPGVSIEEGYADLEKGMAKGKRKYSQKRVDANVALAREVEGRYEAQKERAYYDQMRREANSLGTDIELAAERREDNTRYEKTRAQLLNSIAEGKPLPGRMTEIQAERTVRPGTPDAARIQPTQRIQEAPVPASIAPDPWANRSQVRSFGSMEESIGDEARVRKTRSRAGKPSAGPQMKADGSSRTRQQRSDQILNTLTRMTGRNTRKDLADLENIRTNPKYQRGRRIGYGTAALGTVLGLSNMGNEEEERNYG